ncbi:MAG: methylenetetrahydrofolate reductase [NAD(P)H] [Betaproteobacteria bacterium]|nr:methylenetetrahydrofolate reductase [NAD(P)H] [Betaproteobacteria bacterium]
MQFQQQHPRTYSFEFFPPNTPEGVEKLRTVTQELARLKPKFFSVTYGAGGSTQERTLKAVLDVRAAGHAAAPHISCIGSTRAGLREILQQYKDNGIQHLVALRGDLPSGTAAGGELHYANELVAFIRQEFGRQFFIEVAAYPEYHPQAKSAHDDLLAFKRKVEAGADAAITQYFYNPDCYAHFVNECEKMGITIPIVPGIMPIGRFSQLARFSDACGAEIPRWIRKKLEGYGDDTDSIRAFGLDVVTHLCEQLLHAGAPGLHFYTMNQAELTTEIWRRLGL